MEPAFWQQRWADGRIGFHRPEVNPKLRTYIDRLGLRPGDRVFVPLCGKSVDLPWLAGDQGVTPVGVEVSEWAVTALFSENDIEPACEPRGDLVLWHGGGMAVYCGDYFALTATQLGSVAAAWDRAALIALPADLRPVYVAHAARLLPPGARLLLVTLAYADDGIQGPPFAVQPAEVESLYAPWFDIKTLDLDTPAPPPGDLSVQGVTEIRESVWLLTHL
ncbi:MAG: thiopurine S-methyltransferase [Ectothiorhodospiraceae bacterium]